MKLIRNSNIISMRPSLELREQQYLKHLASALSHYLENPHGTELVCVLGSGYERSNRHALETWVSYHRTEIFERRLEGQSPVDYLITKLEQIILD